MHTYAGIWDSDRLHGMLGLQTDQQQQQQQQPTTTNNNNNNNNKTVRPPCLAEMGPGGSWLLAEHKLCRNASGFTHLQDIHHNHTAYTAWYWRRTPGKEKKVLGPRGPIYHTWFFCKRWIEFLDGPQHSSLLRRQRWKKACISQLRRHKEAAHDCMFAFATSGPKMFASEYSTGSLHRNLILQNGTINT